MRPRVVALVGALVVLANALLGVGFSGATWTGTTSTALSVLAANDWTAPTITVAQPAGTLSGTVAITATASDSRSSIDPATMVVEYRAVGSTTWTALTCTRSGTNPLTASCAWNTAQLPDGGYELRARATDTSGNTGTSATVTTTVRNSVAVALTRVATYLRGTVPVTGTVVASGGATTAQLFLESTPTGGSTFAQLNGGCTVPAASSLTCAWDTTKVADGRYDLRARAVSAGAATATDTQNGVVVDNTAPTGTLTVPAGVLSGTVALNVAASDATSGVATVAVQYRTGTGAWQSCTPVTGSYTCTLDTTKLTNGATYDFQSVVTDAAGNTTTTASQSRVVDNSPATVAITSPASGTVLGGTTTVTVNAGSPRGVQSVRVEYSTGNGTWATACTATAAPYSCTWNTTTLAGGSYQLRAVAVETYGGGTPVSASVPVTVNNTDGTVAVTSPASGATVGGTVALTASAASATGITSVALQVRANGSTGAWTTVCTATASPYACSWVTPTEYDTRWDVRAISTQGNQRVVTSAVVTVTVRNVVGSVSVTSPATGATVRGTATLAATASSNAGVTGVTFNLKAPNGTVTTCPATLSGGSWTCAWNTSAITYGSYVITAVMTQGDGSTLTSAPVTATVDNRVAKGVDVQGANGGTSSVPDSGDTVTFTYNSLMNLSTIQAGLAYGSSVAISASLTGSTGQLGDTLAFPGTNLGTLTVSSNFYSNNKTLTYAATISATQGTDAQGLPVTVVTVRLGAAAAVPNGESLKPVTTAGTLIWTPSSSATDVNGAACAVSTASESGVSDIDF